MGQKVLIRAFFVYLRYLIQTKNMKTTHYLITIFLFLCYSSPHGYASGNADLRILTMQDGLSDNTINSIIKDGDGFMWFATNKGLSRYDGKNIRNFPTTVNEDLQSGQLFETDNNFLWLISKQQLYAFNKKQERLLPTVWEHTGTSLSIRTLLKGKGNVFWAIHQNKLFSFSISGVSKEQVTIRLLKEVSHPLINENFSAMCFSPDSSHIHLATNNLRLMAFSLSNARISVLTEKPYKNHVSVNALSTDGKFIWMATGGQGVLRFNTQSGNYEQFIFNEDRKHSSLSHISAYNLLRIKDNTLFVPTWNGYTLLKTDEKNPSEVTSTIYDNNSFLDIPNIETRMISAYFDQQHQMVWIGTRGGGVIMLNVREKPFCQYHQKRHNEIIDMQIDRYNHIWLTTYHEGLMRSKEPFLNINSPLDFIPVSTGYNRDKYIPNCSVKDEAGDLWFGFSSSILLRWNGTNQILNSYDLSACKVSNGKKMNHINCLLIDHRQRMWLGTSQGLFLFDRATGECTETEIFMDKKKVYLTINTMSQGINGDIWLGTSNGIYRVRLKGNKVEEVRIGYEKQKGLNLMPVNNFLMINGEEAYIGYTGGFAILSQTKDSIIDFYTTGNGLPSNEINCIVQDTKGRIWIGSNSGISRYSRHQKVFYNYYISGSNRSAKLMQNTLFFGNNKSLTYFAPQKMLKTPKTNKVRFLDLEVNHTTVHMGSMLNGQQILAKAITYTDSLTLNYKNKDFSLSFSTLTFNDSKQQYAYRLLPYQKQWVYSHEGDKATYTNLPEGEYKFEVKAVYPDDVVSEVSSLHIKIQPHWSKTTWFALLLFSLAVLSLCLIIYRIKKRQQRIQQEIQLKHELEIVHMERIKENQIKEERELFFTSSAHELRTPLTLILGPLHEILNSSPLPETIREKSVLAMKNAQSLLHLTNQLLYIQKIEAGMVKLILSESDLGELLRQEYLLFKPTAAKQQKKYSIDLPHKSAIAWIDREKVTAAIRNLLSNAFKYTAAGGYIELSLSESSTEKGCYQIIVKDNGSGIPPALQNKVFESFTTGSNATSFSDKVGIGLRIVKNTMDLHHGKVTLESIEGEGTTFTLYFPKGKEHYTQDKVEWAEVQQTGGKEEAIIVEIEQNAPISSPKATLLIIEDNHEIRSYISNLFNKKYQVLEAQNGEEGVQMAKEEQPDLIISDIIMPVMDGFACCKEIKSYLPTAHIPIILLTAKAEDADRMHGSLQGADDYIMKPFNPELLRVRVESLMAQRNQLKRIYTKALMLKENSDNNRTNDFIGKIISIVEANLSNPSFNIKTIAVNMNMSQPTLYRKLKQHTDLSIAEVIRNVRISKAASLILTQKYAIQEVAEMVGFNDLPTFRKYFVKQFGVPPSHYLEHNR